MNIVQNRLTLTGWWFGTVFIFPNIGNNYPNGLIFFRGVETTNQLKKHTRALCQQVVSLREKKDMMKSWTLSGNTRSNVAAAGKRS